MVQQQADALALLAETALHHELDPGAPGERYQVVVHVDAPVLADPEQPGQSVLEDGVRVSAGCGVRVGQATTCATGPRADRPRSRTSRCSVGGTIAVHEDGYQVDRQPDGELRFRRPDGRSFPEVPEPLTVPDDPLEALWREHESHGLRHAPSDSQWADQELEPGG